MGLLGAELRRLREAKGAGLEQVAAATKVGLHHLAALERGEIRALPGDVFVRGFVRAYAGFLGADSERLLDLYRRDHAELTTGAPPAAERTVQEMSRLLAGARSAGRGRLAIRIKLDRRLARLALRIGGLAAAVAAMAALAILVNGRREVEAVRQPQLAGPLRASRAPEVPITASATAPIAADPAPAPSAPSLAATLPAAAVVQAPVVENEDKPRDVPASGEALDVSEHGVGSRIERGRLIGRASVFQEGATVWFWTQVDGGKPGLTIRHVWLRDDREVHSVNLEVGSAQWRTWSRKTLRPGSVGLWSVEARDAYGRVLASDEFECRAVASDP